MNSWQILSVAPEGLGLSGMDMALVFVLAFIVLVLIVTGLVLKLKTFTEELDYLNLEIGRTEGEEREEWIRRRRRHWLTLLPFVKKER